MNTATSLQVLLELWTNNKVGRKTIKLDIN